MKISQSWYNLPITFSFFAAFCPFVVYKKDILLQCFHISLISLSRWISLVHSSSYCRIYVPILPFLFPITTSWYCQNFLSTCMFVLVKLRKNNINEMHCWLLSRKSTHMKVANTSDLNLKTVKITFHGTQYIFLLCWGWKEQLNLLSR